MQVFVTIAMFLCISRLVYSELRNIESIVCTGVCLLAAWLLFRYNIPIPMLIIGGLTADFWDLSSGMLTIVVFYSLLCRMLYWVWICTVQHRKILIRIAIEIWQDKLFSFILFSLLVLYVSILLKMNNVWTK